MVEERKFRHIVRVAQTDLKGQKSVLFALKGIKGVGFMFANAICRTTRIDPTRRMGELGDDDVQKLNAIITNPVNAGIPKWMLNKRSDIETGEAKHVLGGDLSFAQQNDIKRMQKMKCYKGVRHYMGLPVRGQRTSSNHRKNKGKVVGVKKTKVAPASGDKK